MKNPRDDSEKLELVELWLDMQMFSISRLFGDHFEDVFSLFKFNMNPLGALVFGDILST